MQQRQPCLSYARQHRIAATKQSARRTRDETVSAGAYLSTTCTDPRFAFFAGFVSPRFAFFAGFVSPRFAFFAGFISFCIAFCVLLAMIAGLRVMTTRIKKSILAQSGLFLTTRADFLSEMVLF